MRASRESCSISPVSFGVPFADPPVCIGVPSFDTALRFGVGANGMGAAGVAGSLDIRGEVTMSVKSAAESIPRMPFEIMAFAVFSGATAGGNARSLSFRPQLGAGMLSTRHSTRCWKRNSFMNKTSHGQDNRKCKG